MRHQQRIQTVLFEGRSKTTQAASLIHGRKCSKKRLRAPSRELRVHGLKLEARSSPQKRSRRSLGRFSEKAGGFCCSRLRAYV
jgi:hypothetical protein